MSEEINDFFEKFLLRDRKIHRICVHEYQIVIGFDDMYITTNNDFCVKPSNSSGFIFKATFNERSQESFRVCELVGVEVKSIFLTDAKLDLRFLNDWVLTYPRSLDFENFVITVEDLGIYIF